MQHATFERARLTASRLALDCRTLGIAQHERGWDPASYDGEVFAIRTLHAALDAGINVFDTCPSADGGRGESLLGKALHGRLESALVSTRLGRVEDEALLESRILATLRRLRTDHLDIVYLDDRCGQWLPVLAPLARLRERGVVRFFGLEVFHPGRAARLIASGLFDVALFDGNIAGAAQTSLRISECVSRGMGVGIANPRAIETLPRCADELPDRIIDSSARDRALLTHLFTDTRFDFVSLDLHWEHEVVTLSRLVADATPAAIPLALSN